jgi:tetratricopeptide (TPR) repeat protein
MLSATGSAVEWMINKMASYSLVELQSDAFSINPVIHMRLYGRLTVQERQKSFSDAMNLISKSMAHAKIMENGKAEDWVFERQIIFHIQACCRYLKGAAQFFALYDAQNDRALSMSAIVMAFLRHGKMKDSEELSRKAIEQMAALYGQEHPKTLLAIHALAATYFSQKRWNEAEELLTYTIKSSKKLVGYENSLTQSCLVYLSRVYSEHGRWNEAEEVAMLAVETNKRVFGQGHPYTLHSVDNIATIYSNHGRLKEAEEIGTQVVELAMTVLGREHPLTLIYTHNLAIAYKSQGQIVKAITMMEQIARTRSRVLGEDDPFTKNSVIDLSRWRAEVREMCANFSELSGYHGTNIRPLRPCQTNTNWIT